MNPSTVIAPPSPLRRRRPLRAEPLVFALLLCMLTLALSGAGLQAEDLDAGKSVATGQVAAAR